MLGDLPLSRVAGEALDAFGGRRRMQAQEDTRTTGGM
jgi:hypothetical protein